MDLINDLDFRIILWVQNNLRMPILSDIMITITKLGNAGMLFIVISAVLICFRKTRHAGLLMLISMTICYIFNDLIIKNIVTRQRPFITISRLIPLVTRPKSYSFPSGHTAVAFSAMVSLFFTWKKYAFLGLIFAILMGFSRIYVGVHYPTDVMVGAINGVLIACATGMIYKKKFKGIQYEKK